MPKPFSETQLLSLAARLPSDRPFTCFEAERLGVPWHHLRKLRDVGLVVHRLAGVYHWHGIPDSRALRLQCLRLVVPEGYVVVDRTAAWVWDAVMALAPNDHLTPGPLDVFGPPGRRMRNGLTTSGERTLSPQDVVEVDGLLVTTPLRTACDLARLVHRDRALAAMDALAAAGGFTVDELVVELDRFKGMRGVVQARSLAPLVDPRSQSGMETILRLRWNDAGLPRPECQIEIAAPLDGSYFIDIGLPEEQFGGEFFGEEFHGEERREHDDDRLAWARDEQGWTLVVVRRHHVVGSQQDVEEMLRREWQQHRAGAAPRVIDLCSAREGFPTGCPRRIGR